MIEARHARWAHWVFRRYVLRLTRRHFRGVHLLGELPDLPAGLARGRQPPGLALSFGDGQSVSPLDNIRHTCRSVPGP